MNIISQIIEVLRTNKRHKGYEREIELANVQRVKSPVLGTQIRGSNETDYSGSFAKWGKGNEKRN